jgi:hypothetical protein
MSKKSVNPQKIMSDHTMKAKSLTDLIKNYKAIVRDKGLKDEDLM